MKQPDRLRIGVAMGSDSDLNVMRHVGRALGELGLVFGEDYEERILSAHRTPEEVIEYAKSAEERGLRVIIAGAGGSAHLPGKIAPITLVPVLGIAITKSPDVMNRALGSMIGMPEGTPVATFQGEAGAFDAGLFAAKILLPYEPELREAYLDYKARVREAVIAKDTRLAEIGAEAYLLEKANSQTY